MSLIFVFGDAWHMSSFRRTSTALFNPTWNNACLLVIPVVTKAGSSTIPLQRSISSLNRLHLMNVVFPSTLQNHQLISQLLILFLCYQTPLRTCYSIWRGMVM